jgi:hypothetical protein
LILVADSFAGSGPRTYRFAARTGESGVGEPMAQPLSAFPDGSTIWVSLAQFHTRGAMLTPLILAMSGAIRWELHGSGATGEHFLADLDGFPTCGVEIDSTGALCTDRSSHATRLWRASSSSIVERVTELPPSLDLVHVDAPDRVAATERFGSRLVLVDIPARRATRLTLPGANQRMGSRWTADVAARGPYVFVLSAGRDGAMVNRYELR